MELPPNHQTVMPYIVVSGGLKFLSFLKNVFNAEELSLKMRDENLVMNCEFKIGDSTLMFADSRDEWNPQTANLFIYVEDADDTFNKAIQEGSSELMKLENLEYGRSGGIVDPFGNTWWITSLNKT